MRLRLRLRGWMLAKAAFTGRDDNNHRLVIRVTGQKESPVGVFHNLGAFSVAVLSPFPYSTGREP
jgi:hypothetical protein